MSKSKPYAEGVSKLQFGVPSEVVPVYNEKLVFIPKIATPAAGTNLSYKLPSDGWYQILVLGFNLNTAVQVSTRIPDLQVTEGRFTRLMARCSGGATTGQTNAYFQFGLYGIASGASGEVIHTTNLPEHILRGGSLIVTLATLQATDQIHNVSLVCKRWLW